MNKKQWLTACIGTVLLGNVTAMAAVTAEEVDTKVEQLIPRVTAVESKLDDKADKSAVEELEDRVDTHGLAIKALKGNKADKAETEAALGELKEGLNSEVRDRKANEKALTKDIQTNREDIRSLEDTKADKSTVEELEDRVETHGLAIKALKGNKADKAETEAALGELKEGLNNEVRDRKANEKALTEDIKNNRNAIDENRTAIDENRAAIGENRTAIGENRTAIGENRAAIGENRTAIGENRTAIGENRTAIGENRTAIGENRTAIGKVRDDLAGYQAAQKKVDAAQDARLVSEANRLDKRIDRVGALTGALAGLKPIQYDPAAPTQIMAAVATYEGKQGFALGVAHYAKENLMFHAGVAYDGDDKYMGNLGVTVKVGAGSSVADRYSMQRENAELREQLNAQERRIAELERMMMSVAR